MVSAPLVAPTQASSRSSELLASLGPTPTGLWVPSPLVFGPHPHWSVALCPFPSSSPSSSVLASRSNSVGASEVGLSQSHPVLPFYLILRKLQCSHCIKSQAATAHRSACVFLPSSLCAYVRQCTHLHLGPAVNIRCPPYFLR